MLRYSGWTTALTVPAASFPDPGSINHSTGGTFTLGPKFGRAKVTNKVGVEPAELDLEIYAGANDLIGNIPFAEAVRLGFFDGSAFEVDRLFSAPQPGSGGIDVATLGSVVWFYGHVAEAEAGRSIITMKAKSLLDLIATHQFPRRIFQPNCSHVFGDAMCGYLRGLGENALGVATGVGALTVTAQSGSSQYLINAGTSIPAAYAEGSLNGSTGLNAGFTGTIASTGNGSQVLVLKPFPYAVAVGDQFTALPGCDHTPATCKNTFNNFARFGGFPNIPPPEAAI